MKENNNIYYIAYQDFPAETANSQQTIATCKYLVRNGYNVKLFFPLRSASSNDNFDKINEFYSIGNSDFETIGLSHPNNFEKYNYFKKLIYILTHAFWAFKCVKNIQKKHPSPIQFMTRSDWTFYFLSRTSSKVLYECHQITKIRKFLIKQSMKNPNSKIIFLNKYLLADSGITKTNNVIIQNNGYDSDFFSSDKKNKIKNKVIFSGNLLRLGKERNLDFIIDAFKDDRLKNFKLIIVGGSKEMQNYYLTKHQKPENIIFINFLNKFQLSEELSSSEIGLLINNDDKHSRFYTDPLKYYEYLASGLKVIGPDFESHQELKKFGNTFLYKDNDKEDFILTILQASSVNFNYELIENLTTVNSRVQNIISFII